MKSLIRHLFVIPLFFAVASTNSSAQLLESKGDLVIKINDHESHTITSTPPSGVDSMALSPETRWKHQKNIRGRVIDGETGKPLVGVNVNLQFEPALIFNFKKKPIYTDMSGRFDMDLAGPEPLTQRFRITIQSTLIPAYQSKLFEANQNEVEVILPKKQVWLVARLVDRQGQAVPPEEVRVAQVSSNGPVTVIGTGRVGENGIFVYGPVIPGKYSAKILLKNSFGPDIEVPVELKTLADMKAIDTLESTKVALPPRLNLHLVDPQGKPLSNMRISIQCNSAEGYRSAGFSISGGDELHKDYLHFYTPYHGRYVISVTADNYSGSLDPVIKDLEKNPSQDIEIAGRRATARIAGRRDLGKRDRPATILIQPLDRSSNPAVLAADASMAETDTQGRFQSKPLPAGRYNVASLNEFGSIDLATSTTLAEGELKEIVLARQARTDGLPIRGLVCDQQGRPLPGVRVRWCGGRVPSTTTDAVGSWRMTIPKDVLERTGLQVFPLDYVHPDYVPALTTATIRSLEPVAARTILHAPVEVDIQFVSAVNMAKEPESLIKANPERLRFSLSVRSADGRWWFGEQNSPQMALGDELSFQPIFHQATLVTEKPILHQRKLPRGVPLDFSLSDMGEIVGKPVWLLDGQVIASGIWTIPPRLKGRLTLRLPVVMHPPDLRTKFPVHLRVVDMLTDQPIEGVELEANAIGHDQTRTTLPDGSCQITYYPGETQIDMIGNRAVILQTSQGRLQDGGLYFDGDPGSSPETPVVLKVVRTPQRKQLVLRCIDAHGEPLAKPVTAIDRNLRWTVADRNAGQVLYVHNTGAPTADLMLCVTEGTIEPLEVIKVEYDGSASGGMAGQLVSAAQDAKGYPVLHVKFDAIEADSIIYTTVRLPGVKNDAPNHEQSATEP